MGNQRGNVGAGVVIGGNEMTPISIATEPKIATLRIFLTGSVDGEDPFDLLEASGEGDLLDSGDHTVLVWGERFYR